MIGGLDRVEVAKSHEKLHTSHKTISYACTNLVQFSPSVICINLCTNTSEQARSMNICLELAELWSITKIQTGVCGNRSLNPSTWLSKETIHASSLSI
jgi:hypothetical protein